MSHDTHTTSNAHRELDAYGRDGLLNLVRGWTDPFPKPKVFQYQLADGRTINVVRDDLLAFGTKARAGSAALADPAFARFATIVYVQPRSGWAGLSLAELCRQQGKRLILFCPAAATASPHQLACKAAGAELRFIRIAAMPVLQGIARDFANRHGYLFFPLGLAVPAATAGLAKVAMGLKIKPPEVWSVMSTGVLSRALQVAWPDAQHRVVAVARNIKDGEKGVATIYSHPLPFLTATKDLPPYPSVPTYDAKAWSFVKQHAVDGALVWNVAGDAPPAPAQDFDSNRPWGDQTDAGLA